MYKKEKEQFFEAYISFQGIVGVFYDEFAENPRSFYESLTKIYTWNTKYYSPDYIKENIEEFSKKFNKKDYIYRPLIVDMYDGQIHLGHNEFDENSEGIIFINKKQYRNEYNLKRIRQKDIANIENYFQLDIDNYNNYITGNVFYFKTFEFLNNSEINNCAGFYGQNFLKNGLYQESGKNLKKISEEDFFNFVDENQSILNNEKFYDFIKKEYSYEEYDNIIELEINKNKEIFWKENFLQEFLDYLNKMKNIDIFTKYLKEG